MRVQSRLTTGAALGYGHRDLASLYAVLAQTPPTSLERGEPSAFGDTGGDP